MKKPIQFGKYYLLDRINVGGMAEVFRAKAFGVEGFERILAVKRILPAIAEDKEFIEMFIDEAKLAVQLSHANICQIFDLGKADSFYFIALEYVHGKDLRALFDRCKQRPEGGAVTMPVAQACFVTMKMCEGLDYAHNKKDAQGRELHLVHRDVSPQNVIISYDGEVKLIDFGIAKSVGKASKTQAGILKGKFGYMSPEQVRGLPLDRRSDVFSVGIVLYELLTGERLFTGETDFSTLEKVRNVEILPPSTYNRRIPDELERIVMKTLSKDVDDRYQNAIDLHDDLQAFMYTAGEFYSRKDLASWMKRVWAKEIAEETARMEGYRSIAAPPAAFTPTPPPRMTRTSAPPPAPGNEVASPQPARSAPPAPGARASSLFTPSAAQSASSAPQVAAAGDSDLEWDEEELETHVYETAKDASDAVVDELEAVDEVDDENLIDDFELSDDGAPVPAKSVQSPIAPIPPIVSVTPIAAKPEPIYAPPPAAAPAAAKNGAARPIVIAPVPMPMPALMPARPLAPIRPSPAPTRPSPAPTRPSIDLPPMATAISHLPRRPAQRARWPIYTGVAAALLLVSVLGTVLIVSGRPGELQITTDPATGVRILVDNKPVHPDEAGKLKIEPGAYQIAVESDGYVQWRDRLEVKSGEVVKRRVELEPLARSGFTLDSDPRGATALLDGKDLGGKTPFKVEGLPPGMHHLEVQGNGQTWSEDVTLEPGKMIDLKASLVTPTPPPPVVDETPTVVAAIEKPKVTQVQPAPPPDLPPPVTPKVRLPRDRGERPPVARLPKRVANPIAVDNPPPVVHRLPKPPPESPAVVHSDPAPDKGGGADGYLRLGSKPWTKITIDGKDTGLTTPQGKIRLGPGNHKIVLQNPQFQIKESFSVEIKSGETETVIKDLRPQNGEAAQ